MRMVSPNKPGLRVGVFGAGAIGCYLGGRLIDAGHDVVLVGRASEVARHGLTLTDYEGRRWRVPPERARYEADAAALADRQVVLVTVKSPATAAAGAALQAVLPEGALVVSFQNGVGNADTLAAALPRCVVLAGMVPFNVVRQGEGRFHNGTSGPLELARAAGAEGPLACALREAGFAVALHDDLRPVQWSKLLVNLNNSLNALAGVPLREELAQRGYRLLLAAAMREGLRCLRAAGLKPVRIGRLIPSVVPLALTLPDWLFVRAAAAMLKVDPLARSSMWDDLQRGRQTEVDYLNGEILRLGERHGVPTPVNRRIVALIKEAERAGRGSPGLSPAALREAIDNRGAAAALAIDNRGAAAPLATDTEE